MSKATNTLSRRSLISSIAALAGGTAINAVAIAATKAAPLPAAASADTELFARFEQMLHEYLELNFKWMKLHRAGRKKLGPGHSDAAFTEECVRNGCDAASDAMTAMHEEMRQLANEIAAAPASWEALRAKALVVLWESRPLCVYHDGSLDFDEAANGGPDGGAVAPLFFAPAELTGTAAAIAPAGRNVVLTPAAAAEPKAD